MEKQYQQLCDDWLAAWTGNKPGALLEFYTEDAFYLDPHYHQGLQGREQLSDYFSKLLAKNPDWVWTRQELLPTSEGFVLKWKAKIPVGEKTVESTGLDIVEVTSAGKISRNEVYFDRVNLFQAIQEA